MNPIFDNSYPNDEKARQKQRKRQRRDAAQNNWFETSVNGGTMVLALLKDAADKIPAPYVKEAIGYTLAIIRIVQNVKDNKNDFQLIAIDAATLVAHVYRSYEKSEDKAHWPGKQLQEDLEFLVGTLLDIQLFAEARADNSMLHRVFNKDGDTKKIREYRTKLNHAMASFQVVAQLQTYELLRLLKDKVDSDLYQAKTSQESAKKDREEQELLLTELLAEKRRREKLEAEMHKKTAAQVLREEKAAEEMTEMKKKLRELEDKKVYLLQLKIERLKKDEESAKRRREAEEDRERLLLEEIARKERREKEKARRKAALASDSSSEEDDSEDDSSEYDDTDTEDEIIRLAAKQKARKATQKAKRRAAKTTEDYLSEAFAGAGLHPPSSLYPPPGYYAPYMGSYTPSPYPGTSPYGSPMLFPPAPPVHYHPGGKGSNMTINSGNVHTSTVSNVGNDYSHSSKPKKSSKR
ncbi:hypothetical protein CPB83DRAFT_899074 [Crepidotus variabilis]|uniref:Uncharacterized protein n=1 Tax=Crepidotus variabilis TaxID=179855 RepID=A0A9P6E5Y3_9AGAR|nr:hypothetical protein CPB83DRAFT_899074 [Crepidotus variabilis]